MLTAPDAENFHNYVNIFALHHGGDRAKALAEASRVLSDTEAISDAEFDRIANTTFADQLGINSTFAKRNAVMYNDIREKRTQSRLAIERRDDIQRELIENRKINAFHEYHDKDLEDGRIDDTKHQIWMLVMQ